MCTSVPDLSSTRQVRKAPMLSCLEISAVNKARLFWWKTELTLVGPFRARFWQWPRWKAHSFDLLGLPRTVLAAWINHAHRIKLLLNDLEHLSGVPTTHWQHVLTERHTDPSGPRGADLWVATCAWALHHTPAGRLNMNVFNTCKWMHYGSPNEAWLQMRVSNSLVLCGHLETSLCIPPMLIVIFFLPI